MSGEKPTELWLVSGMIVFIGTLGLANIFFLSSLPFNTAATFVFYYGFLHPLTAFFLWTGFKWALNAARLFVGVSLLAGLFLFGQLDNAVLVLSTLLYLYCLLYLFRYDIGRFFE